MTAIQTVDNCGRQAAEAKFHGGVPYTEEEKEMHAQTL